MVSTAALLSRESRRDCKRGVTKWTQLSACNLHAQRQALDHTWPAKNQRTCLGSQGEDHRLKFLLGPHRKQRGRKTVLIPACVFLNLIKIHKGCKIKKNGSALECEDSVGGQSIFKTLGLQWSAVPWSILAVNILLPPNKELLFLRQCMCCVLCLVMSYSFRPHGPQAPLSTRILQARRLEWVAMPSSRACSQPRDRTQVSHIAGEFFTVWATREAQDNAWAQQNKSQLTSLWVCIAPYSEEATGTLSFLCHISSKVHLRSLCTNLLADYCSILE